MQQEKLIEEIFKILTGIELHFYTQDLTEKPSVERSYPPRRLIHDLSFPKNPEVAEKWRRYKEREELEFLSFWQCAITFARFYRTYNDEHNAPPTPLRGL